MCAVYEICDACDVDHFYTQTTCRFPLTARAINAIEYDTLGHPFAPGATALVEAVINSLIEDSNRAYWNPLLQILCKALGHHAPIIWRPN